MPTTVYGCTLGTKDGSSSNIRDSSACFCELCHLAAAVTVAAAVAVTVWSCNSHGEATVQYSRSNATKSRHSHCEVEVRSQSLHSRPMVTTLLRLHKGKRRSASCSEPYETAAACFFCVRVTAPVDAPIAATIRRRNHSRVYIVLRRIRTVGAPRDQCVSIGHTMERRPSPVWGSTVQPQCHHSSGLVRAYG